MAASGCWTGLGWTEAHEAAADALLRSEGLRDGGKVEIASLREGVISTNRTLCVPRRAHARGGHPACQSRVNARARRCALISPTRMTVRARPRRATTTGGVNRSCAPRGPRLCCVTRASAARRAWISSRLYTHDLPRTTTTGDTHKQLVRIAGAGLAACLTRARPHATPHAWSSARNLDERNTNTGGASPVRATRSRVPLI